MRRRNFLASSGLYLGNALLAHGSSQSPSGNSGSPGPGTVTHYGATPSAFAWGQTQQQPPPPLLLHEELAQLGKDRPVVYLSINFFNALIFSRFADAMAGFSGVEFFLGSQHLLATKVTKHDFSGTTGATAEFQTDPSDPKRQNMALILHSNLNIEAQIYIKGDPTKIISTVTVVISQVAVRGSYSNNQLSFKGVDYTTAVSIAPGPNPEQTMQAGGITDVREGTRIEGLIAYGAVPEVIEKTLGQARTINLAELFPSINLGADAELYPMQNFTKLAIVPKTFVVNQTAVCSCAPGVPLDVKGSDAPIKVPPDIHDGDHLTGQITLGGPIAQNIDPMSFKPRGKADRGLAGFYMPEHTYNGLTVQVLPAIEIVAQDNGFIGFDARATVGFSQASVESRPGCRRDCSGL